MSSLPFLKLPGRQAGAAIWYFGTRQAALDFAAANPARVSLLHFGTMSGTKAGRDYVALNVFTPAALRRELAEIAQADRDRAARQADRQAAIAAGTLKLPAEIIPTELGL